MIQIHIGIQHKGAEFFRHAINGVYDTVCPVAVPVDFEPDSYDTIKQTHLAEGRFLHLLFLKRGLGKEIGHSIGLHLRLLGVRYQVENRCGAILKTNLKFIFVRIKDPVHHISKQTACNIRHGLPVFSAGIQCQDCFLRLWFFLFRLSLLSKQFHGIILSISGTTLDFIDRA